MSGKGRGRGWLKLDKPPPETNSIILRNSTSVVMPVLEMAPQILPKYEKFVSVINQYNDTDDGILLNQKYKYTEELFYNECHTDSDVEDIFSFIYQQALHDQIFAAKLVLFTSLNSFRKLNPYYVNLRQLLLNKMQNNFENAQDLRDSDVTMFYNAVYILANFFNKATMAISNRPYGVLAGPLIMYLNMLLDTAQDVDIELFTIQLYSNGAKLHEADKGSELTDLTIKVRNLLINKTTLTEISKVWLLLAIDISNNEFRIMPPELLNYYQMKLGDKAMGNLQKSLSVLSIQTVQPSKKLDNYKSDVNVLQVDVTPSITQPVHQENHANKLNHVEKHSPTQNKNTEEEYTDYNTWLDTNDSNHSKSSGIQHGSQQPSAPQATSLNKTGRPILGAGARKNTKSDSSWEYDKFDNSWGDKNQIHENYDRWDAKQKNRQGSGWGGEKQSHIRAPRNNKGWEHDDRSETDYN